MVSTFNMSIRLTSANRAKLEALAEHRQVSLNTALNLLLEFTPLPSATAPATKPNNVSPAPKVKVDYDAVVSAWGGPDDDEPLNVGS